MPARYETYGPFSLDGELAEHYGNPSPLFWARVEKLHPKISLAIGIYVILAKSKGGKSLPWYVGKTERGFRRRLKQHATTFLQIRQLSDAQVQEVHLIARRNEKNTRFLGVMKGRRTTFDYLEERLIETCIRRNPRLINAKLVAQVSNTIVPGYMNDKGKRSASAASLNALITGN